MVPSEESVGEWQRVSPISVVYFFLKTIPQLAHFWPVVVGFVAAGEGALRLALTYGLPAIVLMMAFIATLQYLVFHFKVEADRIQLRSGILHRTRLTLHFDRVQQADITKPFYFRPLGLTTLSLESAGSQQQEVDLPGIPFAHAEQLRQQVLEHASVSATETTDGPDPLPFDYELRLSGAEVARYGLMHNALLFLAPLAAPLGQYLGPAMDSWVTWLQRLPWFQHWEQTQSREGFWLLFLVGALFILLGIALLFAISTALALIYYWDYHLFRQGERFQAQSGLGTQRTSGFRLQKLQKVTIAQGLIARFLKRFTVAISKAGSFKMSSANDKSRFVIPVVTSLELQKIRSEFSLPEARWTRVHPFHIADHTITVGTLLFLVGGGFLLVSPLSLWEAVSVALLSYPLVALLAWRRWFKLGYFANSEWMALRQGFWGHKEQWLPTGKLQKLAVSEGPVRRMLGLVHLTVWNTDGPLVVGYLPRAVADALRDQLLVNINTYRKAWF